MFKFRRISVKKLSISEDYVDSPLQDIDNNNRNSLILNFLIVVFFIVGLLFINGVQTINAGVQGMYAAEFNLVGSQTIQAPRGIFYDRDGNKLVVNQAIYKLTTKSNLTEKDIDEIYEILSEYSDVEEINLNISTKVLASGLNTNEVIDLQNKLNSLDTEIVLDIERYYLYPFELAHVLGYMGEANDSDVQNGYKINDKLGKFGLELSLEEDLKGLDGKKFTAINSNEEISYVPGYNIFLTINLTWQRSLYKLLSAQVDALNAEAGAIVITDISNGDILAYVSYPSFNSNLFNDGISSQDYSSLINDPRKPLLDKVIGLQAPPGSTFKIATAYALLQEKIIDENTHVFSDRCMQLGNYPFCEFGRYFIGDLEITRALTRSSNIFFCDGMLRLENSGLGYESYFNQVKELGFGQKTGIDLQSELPGLLPSPEFKMKYYNENWFFGDSCNTSIGQGMVLATPLQMTMAVATIYNGGNYYKPNLISKILDQQGNVVKDDFVEVVRKVSLDQKTRDLIMSGMKLAVTSSEGTAYNFLHDMPGNFTSKTGSAEAYRTVNGELQAGVHGWEVGTFEYEGKTFAFTAHINFGGGGWNVMPVVRNFAGCLFNNFPDGCI